jgi:bile acid:Na+ symporter, BASS family
MHNSLLVVIVTFGLIFVVTASLAQGLSFARPSAKTPSPLQGHTQLTVMILISSFILIPALMIGLGALIHFDKQVKMAIVVLALTAGAPFVPWLVSLAKGNLMYSGAIALLLLVLTIIILPLLMPPLVRALNTGASPSIWVVFWPMLIFMLLPLVLGVVIRNRYPQLAMQIMPWLGPISLTFLVVHISLFIGYSWSQFLSIAGYGQMAFTLLFPLAGLLIGYLMSPPYVLSPLPPADPHRATKIVSMVAVAQQNTGAVICCAIFAFGKYVVAGDYLLLGAIVTIVVVMLFMLELGKRFEDKQGAIAAPAVASAAGTVAAAGEKQPVGGSASPAGVVGSPKARASGVASSGAPAQVAQGDE